MEDIILLLYRLYFSCLLKFLQKEQEDFLIKEASESQCISLIANIEVLSCLQSCNVD